MKTSDFPVFPKLAVPRFELMVTLLTTLVYEILSSYFTVTICPNTLNVTIGITLSAFIGNPNCLKGLVSSGISSLVSSIFFLLLIEVNILNEQN